MNILHPQNIIEVKNLCFTYNKNKSNVIKNVTFSIKKSSYTCIIGHNGSGKSTISKLLIGILLTDSGSIKISNIILNKKNLKKVKHETAIVFQNPENQFIGSTVSDDIAFGLENYQIDPAKMPEIINQVAKKTGVSDLLQSEPASLSGGQKQRVAIASALALDSKILIFDEATSMLDPKGKQDIKSIMLDLKKNTNKTIISITHDMSEIINADQILVFNQGQLEMTGTPEEVVKNPTFLTKISLDIPDILKFTYEMEKVGFDIKHTLNQRILKKQLEKLFKNE